ncbi:unnamed protein product [Closterium sp. Naga37s-1]|nr:unnamed protein product [Closterium sp. Naga37s-1]
MYSHPHAPHFPSHQSTHSPTSPPTYSPTHSSLLFTLIRDVPDSKEDVYRALDAWAAFQLDFPLLAVKRALRMMQQEGQWKRILQVCKWMLARGQGRTFGTYDLMMEAMAATGRHAELDGTWERIMGRHLDTVPRATFARVMSLYMQQGRPLKVLEVYGSMIELGVNLDEGMVMQVHRALINIGAEQRAEALLQEHQSVLTPPVGKATPSSGDPIDMLPEHLWHKAFLYLLLPPGSSHPINPLPFSPMSPMPPISITRFSFQPPPPVIQ